LSVRFKCPTCGTRDSAPDELGGQKLNCRKCGQKIRIPLAKSAEAHAASASRETAPAAPQFQCAACQQQFAVEDVYDQEGVVICKSCFARQQAGEVGVVLGETPPSQEWIPEPEVQPEPIRIVQHHCASCGVQVWPETAEQAGDQLLCVNCSMLAAANTPAASSPVATRPPVPAPKKQSYALWIGGGVAAAVVLIVVLVIALEGHGTADQVAVAPKSAPANAPAPTPALNKPPVAPVVAEPPPGNPTPTPVADPARVQTSLVSATPPTSPMPEPKPVPADPSPAPAPPTNSTPSPAPAAPPEPTGNWEQQHAAEIKRLLRQADTDLAANNIVKAALTYKQLFQLVGPHLPDIQDTDLRKQVSNAAITRGKLLTQVKSSPESVSLTAGTLLASGLEALNEQHWQAGIESLADVRELFDHNIKMADRVRDPNYVMALHGIAVAYLKTKQVPKAGELFEDTAPLGQAVDREATRELVINRAVVDIIQHTKAMRAAKSIKTYLEKHPNDPPDETLLNLLGTSLFVAEQHTAAKGLLEQCAKLYETQNARLEQTRPGEKRWGVEWLAERDAQKKFDERKQLIDKANQLAAAARAAYAEWERQQQLYIPRGPQHIRQTTQAAVNAAEGNYNGTQNAAKEAEKKVGSLPWLTDINPVLPPMPGGLTVVAAAAPTESGGNEPPIFSIQNFTPASGAPDNSSAPPPAAPPADMAPPAPVPKNVHISIPRHALAFAIDKNRMITSGDVVGNVTQVRMEDAQGTVLSAHVIAKDGHLALLELDGGQPGFGHYLNLADSFTGGPIQCSAVPQENVFGPAQTTLTGQATAPPAGGDWAVSLNDHPRLAGSPLLNSQGQVVGVIVASREDPRTRLPAIPVNDLRQFLAAHGGAPGSASSKPDPQQVFEVTVQEN